MNNKTVGIIGAGIGGLTTGVLLIKKGYNVTIFEKESIIGGRALSLDMSKLNYESYTGILSRFNICIPFSEPSLKTIFNENNFNGYRLDLGFHVLGGGIIKKIADVLSLPRNEIEILETRLYQQKNGHYHFFVTGFEKLKMLPNIVRLLIAGEKTMRQLDVTPMTETIQKYGKGKMKQVLEVNSRLITTVNNLALISTGEVFRTQKDMRLKGVYYPKNGLSYLSKKLADFIQKNDGEIYLDKPVSEIIVNDNKASGIIAGGKKYTFDFVISNVLVQNLFDIIDEKHFPKKYVKELKSLEGSGSLCAYYSLKKLNQDLIGKTFIFLERDLNIDGNDAAGMIDFMASSEETNFTTQSNYIVQSYVICTPKEAKNRNTLKKLKNVLDKNLERIIPDYKSNLNWAIYPTIWHLDGVAKTIDNEKPDIKTPIKNLYLIGDCVKAPGIGFNCAINSARILTDFLEQKNS